MPASAGRWGVPNARFWTYHHGSPVKLTLVPGDACTVVEGGRHEEGYSYETTDYEHADGAVFSTITTVSRDCDGRFSSVREFRCSVSELKANDGFPAWEPVSSSQRDYSAEAMGY